jgi:hypothetical protein
VLVSISTRTIRRPRCRGVLNDAHDVAAILKTFLGFKDSDITILTDAQATKQNIIAI